MKMSEMIIDLASDYIELGSTLEEKQSHLNVVCIAWNISILPKSARKMALTHFFSTLAISGRRGQLIQQAFPVPLGNNEGVRVCG